MMDLLGYGGKRVVVTGAASGMGEATARLLNELGAKVYALDLKEVIVPVEQYIKMNLMEKESIDAAVDRIPDNIDALFNCAGIVNPPMPALNVTLVNFAGHRHLTERLLPKIVNGGAIAFISSQGGVAWKNNLDNVNKLLATKDFDEARSWLEANEELNDGYVFSKQCICTYVKTQTAELAKRLIRINCIMPGSTDTRFMGQFRQDGVVDEDADLYDDDTAEVVRGFLRMIQPLCGRHATAEEQAEPLIFLNSNMARFISGVCFCVDYGHMAAVEVGQIEDYWGLNT